MPPYVVEGPWRGGPRVLSMHGPEHLYNCEPLFFDRSLSEPALFIFLFHCLRFACLLGCLEGFFELLVGAILLDVRIEGREDRGTVRDEGREGRVSGRGILAGGRASRGGGRGSREDGRGIRAVDVSRFLGSRKPLGGDRGGRATGKLC